MNRKNGLMAALTVMGVLSLASCGSNSSVEQVTGGNTGSGKVETLSMDQANQPLVSGALAELLALKNHMGWEKALQNDQIAQFSSASDVLYDVMGRPVAYLVLTGTNGAGNLWDVASSMDNATAKQKSFYTSVVSSIPMRNGLQWEQVGIRSIKEAQATLDKLGGKSHLDKLVFIKNSLVAKLKSGKFVWLESGEELTQAEISSAKKDALPMMAAIDASAMQQVNGAWSQWSGAMNDLAAKGIVEEQGQVGVQSLTSSASATSHLNYKKLIQQLGTSIKPTQLKEGTVNSQSEVGSSSCWWIFCAYQYDGAIDATVKSNISGGFAQYPSNFENVATIGRYVASDCLGLGGLIPSPSGCGPAALISLTDYFWRFKGVKWYNMASDSSAATIYNYTNPTNQNSWNKYYAQNGGSYFNENNHPAIKMGKKNADNRSIAMNYTGTCFFRNGGASGLDMMSNAMGNFLSDQKASYTLGTTGQSLTAFSTYHIGTGWFNGGTMATYVRNAMGTKGYPVIMAYDLGSGLGGHITLATDYMVYYPSNGGAIEVHMTPVDKSDTRYAMHNSLYGGVYGWY